MLHYSLRATKPAHPFLLLVTPNVSVAVRAKLAAIGTECASWTQFNSGLLVVEPSTALFEDMRRQLAGIDRELRSQTFLHQYFPDWPSRHELHLDHRYNIFDVHLDRYEELFGWGMDEAKVIHFIGDTKPWDPAPRRWRLLTPLAAEAGSLRLL